MKQYYKRLDLRAKKNTLKAYGRSKEDKQNLDNVSLRLAKLCNMSL